MLWLVSSQINNLVLSGFEFDVSTWIFSSASKIDKLTIENSVGSNLDPNYGIFRDTKAYVKELKILNCEFVQNHRLFESVFESIEVGNLTLMPNPTTSLHPTPFIIWGGTSPKTVFKANNVLLMGSGYVDAYHYFVGYNNQANGYVYLNNVKHYSVATPIVSGIAKRVLVNCEPLFVS